MHSDVQEFINEMWVGAMRRNNEEEARRAAADPDKHKLSRVFDNSSYRYFKTRNGRGSEVRFCYSVHRNVAGYFLGWTETLTKKAVKRDNFHAAKSKRDIVDRCRRALRDSEGGAAH